MEAGGAKLHGRSARIVHGEGVCASYRRMKGTGLAIRTWYPVLVHANHQIWTCTETHKYVGVMYAAHGAMYAAHVAYAAAHNSSDRYGTERH